MLGRVRKNKDTLPHQEIQTIFSRERSRLLAYAYAILKDYDLAEDVVQNVSVISLKKSDFIEHDNPLGWLLKTTRFEALNAYRKHKKVITGIDHEIMLKLEQVAHNLSLKYDNSYMVNRLHDCMALLSERQSRMMKLRYRENIKGEALAKAVNMTKMAMFKALNRTQKKLRACMESSAHG